MSQNLQEEAKKLQEEAKKQREEAENLQYEAEEQQEKAENLQYYIRTASPTLSIDAIYVNTLFNPFIIISEPFYTSFIKLLNIESLKSYIDNIFKHTFKKITNLYITIKYLVKYLVNVLLKDARYDKSVHATNNINDKILILGSINDNFLKIKALLKKTEGDLLLYNKSSEIKEDLYNCIISEKQTETYIKTASAYLDINNIKAYEKAFDKYEDVNVSLRELYNSGDPAKKTKMKPYKKIMYQLSVSHYKEANTAHEEAKRLFYFNKKDEPKPPPYILQFLEKIEDSITEINILKDEIPLLYNEEDLAAAELAAEAELAAAELAAPRPAAPAPRPLAELVAAAEAELAAAAEAELAAAKLAAEPAQHAASSEKEVQITNPTELSDNIFDSNKIVSEQYRMGAHEYVNNCRKYGLHENANNCSQHFSLSISSPNVIRLIFDYCSEYYDNIGNCIDIFTEGGKTLTFYKIFLHNSFNLDQFNASYTTLTKLYNDNDNDGKFSHLLSIKIVETPNINTYDILISHFNHHYEGTSRDIKIYIVGMEDDKVDLKIYEMTPGTFNKPEQLRTQLRTQLKYILYLGNATNVSNGNTDVDFAIKRVIYVYSKTIVYDSPGINAYLYKIHPDDYANQGFTENILYCLYNIDFITFTKDYLDYIVKKAG
jgi:hypothetical protein